MARTALTLKVLSRAGVDSALAAANADGHFFVNSGKEFIEVENASASPITVTIPIPKTVDGQALAAKTVAVPASGKRSIGPFIPDIYNQAGGVVHVDFSAVATVTCAAFQLNAGV
jgi:hypothetical protein